MSDYQAAGEYQYAGFWWRFIAYLIDGLIIWAGSVALALPIVLFGVYANISDNLGGGLIGLADIAGVWLYFALQESSTRQATVGKRCCKIIVTDIHGNRISFGRATGRYFAKIISSFILLIGYFMAGWTRRKQALHDIIADCLVLRRRPVILHLPGESAIVT